jgi:hypothetical protein
VPASAFYAFPNVSGTKMETKALADLLLNEAGVACLDGTAFGKHGAGHLRFSYANSLIAPRGHQRIRSCRTAGLDDETSRRTPRVRAGGCGCRLRPDFRRGRADSERELPRLPRPPPIQTQALDKDGWTKMVASMVDKGAEVKPDELAPLWTSS